ncbi:hypothetical protein [Paraburkholderia caribensis]|uniref:hypothetical protein n=1 Tax=Paraburkholderia caribensis TaxID=75105 RepID=UPI001D0903B1|nr:hypothetical protein [Paraburkholderia caribensis]
MIGGSFSGDLQTTFGAQRAFMVAPSHESRCALAARKRKSLYSKPMSYSCHASRPAARYIRSDEAPQTVAIRVPRETNHTEQE